MNLQVDGKRYEGFTGAACNLRLDALCNTFTFEATAEEGQPLPFRGGEACEVIVSDELALTGFIENVNVSGDAESHTIRIGGRDKPADLLDSDITALADFKGSLKGIIEKVVAHIKADLKVIDEANPAVFSPAEDILAPEPGDNCFDFIGKLARNRNVLLSSTPEGNILITKGSGTAIDASVENLINGSNNSVLQFDVSYDTTGRYRLYQATTQLNIDALNDAGDTDVASIVSQFGSTEDDAIRIGRQRVIIGESNMGSDKCLDRAVWEKNITRARGKTYSCRVHEYRNGTGDLWQLNTIITVSDDFAGIPGKPMLVNSVAFNFTEDEGRSTTLGLIEPDAYSLSLENPEEIGIGLVTEDDDEFVF